MFAQARGMRYDKATSIWKAYMCWEDLRLNDIYNIFFDTDFPGQKPWRFYSPEITEKEEQNWDLLNAEVQRNEANLDPSPPPDMQIFDKDGVPHTIDEINAGAPIFHRAVENAMGTTDPAAAVEGLLDYAPSFGKLGVI
jgi:hypothetical protein